MKEVALNLRNTILRAETELMKVTDHEAGQPLLPGKWCSKEVVGHLKHHLGQIFTLPLTRANDEQNVDVWQLLNLGLGDQQVTPHVTQSTSIM